MSENVGMKKFNFRLYLSRLTVNKFLRIERQSISFLSMQQFIGKNNEAKPLKFCKILMSF